MCIIRSITKNTSNLKKLFMHLKQHIQQEQKVRPYSARQSEKQNVGGPRLLLLHIDTYDRHGTCCECERFMIDC